MSVEKIVTDIKETEASAEKTVNAALVKSKEMVAEAKATAEQMLEDLGNAKTTQTKEAIARVQAETQLEIDEEKKQNALKCDEVKAQGAERIEAAIRLVTERIVSFNGHS